VVRDAIASLRDKRGAQRVTFADVCDHLLDFRRRAPEHTAAIDAFATFLTNVEEVDHAHREEGGPTLAVGDARDVRT
jgi:hypothetical protein